MKRTFIIGAGGHAKVVADLVALCGTGLVQGFIDNVSIHRRGELFYASQIVGTLNDLFEATKSIPREELAAIVAIGDCKARMALASQVEEAGFELLTLVHPTAAVSNTAKLGKGTVVCAHACINSDAVIGNNVIVNTAASVDHDCFVADGAHLAPRATLGGWCKIGTASFVGIGAVCRDRVSVGQCATVGAGGVVVRDVPDYAVAYGNPARVKRFQASE